MTFAYTTLVTILAIFLTSFFMVRTGLNRGKYKIKAPKMTGNETWERYCRVHANTVEQMVIFLPALWLAAFSGGDQLAAGIGAVWLIGRMVYSKIYVTRPPGRAPGMVLTLLPTLALALVTLYYAVLAILN